MPTFYEFFAGGGMARAGLGAAWTCLFANDLDEKKAAIYRENWGDADLWLGDIAHVTTAQLLNVADLAWASFPCQDLSLAGSGAGLSGARSGTFWAFWKQIVGLRGEGRAPATIVLENVVGAITSHNGRDFSAIISALSGGGYRCGAVVIDAVHFLPQSRPRFFVIGVRDDLDINTALLSADPIEEWHSQALRIAQERLPDDVKASWVWWNLPRPVGRDVGLADLIEEVPSGVKWHSMDETERLLSLMNDTNRKKVDAAKRKGQRMVGTVYKRTRRDSSGGEKAQRAEVRFDNVAGCLRTPLGGSSRQTIIIVEGDNIRSRLLSPREAARLMGLSDEYVLPAKYNDAYHLAGDGVAVPVVRFLAEHILDPILFSRKQGNQEDYLMTDLDMALSDFNREKKFGRKGPLGVALVTTQHARKQGLPLDHTKLVTEGGGQVLGLGKASVQSILGRHGIDRVLAAEGGRTSRGSIGNMQDYVAFLNDLHMRGIADLDAIEHFWIDRVQEFFAGKPFKVRLDGYRSLRVLVRDMLVQAEERQKSNPGMQYMGAVLQHLIGAKLDCALGVGKFEHHSFSTSDAQSGRAGDFFIGDVAVHVTTAPGEGVVQRCQENLNDGIRPIIVTTARGLAAAEVLSENSGIGDRVDVFEAEQFIALNLYELGKFADDGRKVAVSDLVTRYNEIVEEVETDPSLRIEFRK